MWTIEKRRYPIEEIFHKFWEHDVLSGQVQTPSPVEALT